MGKPNDLKTALSPADTSREAALREMYAGINDKHMFPFWAKQSDVEHDEVRQLMPQLSPELRQEFLDFLISSLTSEFSAFLSTINPPLPTILLLVQISR